MAYTIISLPGVDDDFDRLSTPEFSRIKSAVLRLADNPRPPGSKKLAGLADIHRIRVGKYRIVYRIQDKKLVVMVIAVAERGRIYPLAKRRIKK